MKFPLILVNFKMYEEIHGKDPNVLARLHCDRALKLAKIHEKVARETGVNIALAVSVIDLACIAPTISLPIFVQHVDARDFGPYTGYVVPRHVKLAGAFGTLLNHSEHRITRKVLKESIKLAHKGGLYVVACAKTAEEGKIIAKMKPDLVAVEPPELIGGNVSVSKAQPEVIEKAVRLIGKGKVLVGAGIKTGGDVKKALELGASGVLLASGVALAKDPEGVLRDLVSGIK